MNRIAPLAAAALMFLSGCVWWRSASLAESGGQTVFTYTFRGAGLLLHAQEVSSEKSVVVFTMLGEKDIYRDDEVRFTVNGQKEPFKGTLAIDRQKKTVTLTTLMSAVPAGTYRY